MDYLNIPYGWIAFYAFLDCVICFTGAYFISRTKWYPPTKGDARLNRLSRLSYFAIGALMFMLGIINGIRVNIAFNGASMTEFAIFIRMLRDVVAFLCNAAAVVFIGTIFNGLLKTGHERELARLIKNNENID